MNTAATNPFTVDEIDAMPVQVGLDELLEELMETPEAAALQPAQRRLGRWPLVVAVAASVTLIAAVPAYLGQRSEDGVSGPTTTVPTAPTPAAPTPTSEPAPPEPPTVPESSWTGPSSYAVLDAPGWTLDPTSPSTDPSYDVSISYLEGGKYFTLAWIRERWYGPVLKGARRESQSGSLPVLGEQAEYFVYESSQQMAYLPVVDGYGLRVEGTFTSPGEFEDLVTRLSAVNETQLGRLLPQEVVTPEETRPEVEGILESLGSPEGVELPEVAGFNARYSLAIQVVEPVRCALAEQFVAARATGDLVAQQTAADAIVDLPSAPAVLDDLDDPEYIAQTARLVRKDASDSRILVSSCPSGGLS